MEISIGKGVSGMDLVHRMEQWERGGSRSLTVRGCRGSHVSHSGGLALSMS